MTLFDNKTPDQVDYKAKVAERFTKDDGSIDVDALSKSWAHSQEHITKVESDAAELRADNIKRLSYEDLLSKLEQRRDSNADNGAEDHGNRNNEDVDLDALVDKRLNDRFNQFQQSTIQSDNRAFVRSELEKAWGSDFVEKLKTVTKELGKTEEQMNKLAGEDPQFLIRAVLGGNTQPKPIVNTSAPRSSISARTLPKGKSKYEEFKEVMKTDPKKYQNVHFQNEMLRVAKEMGDDFYRKG